MYSAPFSKWKTTLGTNTFRIIAIEVGKAAGYRNHLSISTHNCYASVSRYANERFHIKLYCIASNRIDCKCAHFKSYSNESKISRQQRKWLQFAMANMLAFLFYKYGLKCKIICQVCETAIFFFTLTHLNKCVSTTIGEKKTHWRYFSRVCRKNPFNRCISLVFMGLERFIIIAFVPNDRIYIVCRYFYSPFLRIYVLFVGSRT